MKDGDKIGWNYVSFRDDNIRIDHKWVDGEQRFSMSVNPKLGEDIREAVNTDRNTKTVVSGHKEVVFASHAPEVLIASGIPDGRIYTHAFILRKMKDDHDLDEVAIENLVSSAQSPAAILHDVDKKKGTEAFIILTEQTAKDLNGRVAPVMIYLRPDSNGNYIASAYARTEKGEKHYIGLLNSGNLLAINKNKVAGLNLTGEAKSSFESVRTDDNVVDLERFTPTIVSNSLPENNGPSAEKAYAYEVREIEVLPGTLVKPKTGLDPRGSTSISGGILLQGVRNHKRHMLMK